MTLHKDLIELMDYGQHWKILPLLWRRSMLTMKHVL